MRGILESSQTFRWQRVQLHIAPEGLAVATRRGFSPEALVQGAEFKDVIAADVIGRGRKVTLRIQFSNALPPWEIPWIKEAEAHWAAELIRNQIALIHRARSIEFQTSVSFDAMQAIAEKLLMSSERATVDLVDFILFQAVFHRASDVHFDSVAAQFGEVTNSAHPRSSLLVRYRIDGTLRDVMHLSLPWRERVINRLKAAARLSTFRSDIPQEGRLVVNVGNRNIDLRLTSLPTLQGEKISVRIFDPAVGLLSLDRLGIDPNLRMQFQQVVSLPEGLVLLTGPSGSGKTTTLYAALDWIREHRGDVRLIATVEDPIEFDMKTVSQTQVNPAIGLNFAAGLRSVLRQDPQVIMLGEIRDAETAETAVRAGLTGHLILSTVHALSAQGVYVRLSDIGIEPYLIASSVTAVLAQRLVRTICNACREKYQPEGRLLDRLPNGRSISAFERGRGCANCAGSGYAGRTGLFEFIETSDVIRDLIMRRRPLRDFEDAAARGAMSTMLDDGLPKVASGVTTLEELERVGVLNP